MHRAKPRPLREGKTAYEWLIADSNSNDWKLLKLIENRFKLRIGIFNLVSDLEAGLFGPSRYFNELNGSASLRHKCGAFIEEARRYGFRLE
jgi:hypothetical protein